MWQRGRRVRPPIEFVIATVFWNTCRSRLGRAEHRGKWAMYGVDQSDCSPCALGWRRTPIAAASPPMHGTSRHDNHRRVTRRTAPSYSSSTLSTSPLRRWCAAGGLASSATSHSGSSAVRTHQHVPSLFARTGTKRLHVSQSMHHLFPGSRSQGSGAVASACAERLDKFPRCVGVSNGRLGIRRAWRLGGRGPTAPARIKPRRL